MRRHRWLATSVGLALLLTTAASTTYAEGYGNPQDSNGNQWFRGFNWCNIYPFPGCPQPTPQPHLPTPSATPELDSLLLFGVGLSGLGGYAVTRYRARRRT